MKTIKDYFARTGIQGYAILFFFSLPRTLKAEDRYEVAPGVFREYEKSHPRYRSDWRARESYIIYLR